MEPLSGQLRLDFRSAEPLYLQIAGQIEQMVARGELKVGEQLPTVREMATELRINFNTVARAYRLLDDSHLISTQRGRGTYIWAASSEETVKQFKKKTLEELTRIYRDEVIRLGYSLEEAIAELKTPQPSDIPTALEDSSEDKPL